MVCVGPPLGHGDLCSTGNRAGCQDLLEEIQGRIHPRVHIFGHIHEGYGVTTDSQCVYVNASTCTLHYRPINPPIVFDLPWDKSLSPRVISFEAAMATQTTKQIK